MDSNTEPYPALGVLPAPWEEVLSRIGEHSEVAAGDDVDGRDDGTTIALIRAGLARVFVRTTPGRQATIGYAKRGDVIGLPPRLGSRRYEVTAVRDTTVAVLIVERLSGASAVEAELLLQVQWRRASWAYNAAVNLAAGTHLPISARVAQHLRELAVRAPDGRAVAQVSHQSLATFVGTAREVVTRQLRALREESVIETQPGRVVVVNEERLGLIAAGGDHLT